MSKRKRPIDKTRDAALYWGLDIQTNAPCLVFNLAAWQCIRFLASAAGIDPEAVFIRLFMRPLMAAAEKLPPPTEAERPKVTFEWIFFDDGGARVVFCGETFPLYCRCVDLAAEDAKHFLGREVADNLLLPFYDFEPQGNA